MLYTTVIDCLQSYTNTSYAVGNEVLQHRSRGNFNGVCGVGNDSKNKFELIFLISISFLLLFPFSLFLIVSPLSFPSFTFFKHVESINHTKEITNSVVFMTGISQQKNFSPPGCWDSYCDPYWSLLRCCDCLLYSLWWFRKLLQSLWRMC